MFISRTKDRIALVSPNSISFEVSSCFERVPDKSDITWFNRN